MGSKSPHPGIGSLGLPDRWAMVEGAIDEDVVEGWLSQLGDAQLESLVREGLTNNPGLAGTLARLKSIRETIRIVRASQFPLIGSSVSGSRNASAVRDGLGDLGSFDASNNYAANLNISWEVDVWGRLDNLRRAAVNEYEAAEADYRGVRLSLAAAIASAYCNLVTARQQVELSRQTRDSFERNFRITERNYKAGDTSSSPLDVQFGRNNVASAERTLISRQLFENDARRNLEILLGRYPDAEIVGEDELPVLVESVPAGIPSDLLMRRPDLVAAAARLDSATMRRSAAKKNLLPSISLTAGGSARSNELADLIANPQSLAANLAGSISQPVFRSGALRAQARQAQNQEESALQNFISTALSAFREVEAALDREASLAAQERYLDTELAQAILAEEQSSRDYSEGIVGILSVLEAQRRAFNARNAMIALRNSRIQNRIDLYLALGGDFHLSHSESAAGFHEAQTTIFAGYQPERP